jgi:hypothetical protein
MQSTGSSAVFQLQLLDTQSYTHEGMKQLLTKTFLASHNMLTWRMPWQHLNLISSSFEQGKKRKERPENKKMR